MGLIENFQERRNTKFERMVEDSVVRKTKTVPAKKLHLVSTEKRKWSLLLLLVTFLYTIFTKLILKKSGFDLLIALNIGLFITELYLRANGNSIWALNHAQRMNFINTLNKLITTVIFFWTTYLQVVDLLDYISANQETFNGIIAAAGSQGAGIWDGFLYLLKERTVFIVSLVYSVVMFLPILFFFIKKQVVTSVKSIGIILGLVTPILNIILIFKWIVSFRDFKEYKMIDEQTCEINYRRLRTSGKLIFKAILRTVMLVVFAYAYLKLFGLW